MKKLLLILLCLPLMTLAQQTYVPDDNFEAWIETSIPAANNGVVNDNYVLTGGLHQANWNPIISNNNNQGPFFDITGIEDFECWTLLIENTFITTLDLSNLDWTNVSATAGITIRQNQYLEEIFLPNHTDSINLLHISENDSLNNIVFHSGLSYNRLFLTSNESLCELVFKGKIIAVTGWPPRITIDGCSNIEQLDFSGITDAPYQSTIYIHSSGPSNLQQINLNNNVSIYNWIFSADITMHPNFSCFEVNSQSAVNFCTGNNAWPSFLNYSTNCYSPINCQSATSIEEQYSTKKTLIRIIDILGREMPYKKRTPLFYI